MREIALTRGQVALVDDADYERIAVNRWHCTRNGYAARSPRIGDVVTFGYVLMHREILGFPSEPHIDHIDGNGLNNCRANLRACSGAQNQGNRRKTAGKFSSSFKGVTRHKGTGKWLAAIYVNCRQQYLGLWKTEGEAARAYDRAAREIRGEFARLNFPDENAA